MKKAEEIIYEHYGCKSWEEVCRDFLSEVSPAMIKEIVKIAQIDTIEATTERCAEVAELTEFRKTPQDRNSISNDMGDIYAVNKESILQVAEELKKELE